LQSLSAATCYTLEEEQKRFRTERFLRTILPMAVLPIVTGDTTPVLRTVSKNVPQVTKTILALIKDMEETLKDEGGLGLAAPQVGESLQICLAQIGGKVQVLVNPEITWRSKEADTEEEGCLSLPNIVVAVMRPREIVVRYRNRKGMEEERRLKDMDARVVQHEMDHLNGVLIVDYLSSPATNEHRAPVTIV